MAKRKNWISYENASKIAREAGCKSRKQFMEWHERTGVKDIPKQPNRVYSDWEGWPEFLATRNIFASDKDSEKQQYRRYWEAVRWAQVYCSEHDITTGQGWKHAYTRDRETNAKQIPEDIPKHPENFYKEEWTGWPAWLGKGVREKLAAQRQEIALVCIATASWRPANVIQIVVAKDGEGQLIDQLFQKQLQPQKIYKYDQAVSEQLQQALQRVGKLQPDGSWIVSNVPYLLSEFDFILEIYRTARPDVYAPLFKNQQEVDYEVEDKTHTQHLTNGTSNFV